MDAVFDKLSLIKIFLLTALSFVITILWTPLWTNFLYKHKLGKTIREDPNAPVFTQLHMKKSGTPTMGGVLIWVTTLFLAVVIWALARYAGSDLAAWLNFLSRQQTLLPLGALVAAALIGIVDDYLNVRRIGAKGGGISEKQRWILYFAIAAVGAWWFFSKLDWDILHVPFVGDFSIGWWYIPVFIFVIVGTSFSVNLIDGLDGLAGGTLLAAFVAYSVIAFAEGRFELAAFCGVIAGALLAFLWFNIPPARFFMGDTGVMALGVTLGIVAMLTNTALLLPVIGFLFVVESASVMIQRTSKRLRKKKVFLSAPIHHHLEAIGWPEQKIVMRFWVIAAVTAVVGVALHLVERT